MKVSLQKHFSLVFLDVYMGVDGMNKYVAFLAIVVVLLSVVCGSLFVQIVDLQNRNSRLYDEKIVFRDMILEYQDQIAQLESRISDLESQISELQNQLGEQEAERMLELSNAYQVKIMGITFEVEHFSVVSIADLVTVTVKNFGEYDVGNLVISVRLENDPFLPQVREEKIELLKGGEEEHVTFVLDHPFGPLPHWVATLWFEDMFLDEYVYYI